MAQKALTSGYTYKQREVLDFLARGYSSKEIAKACGVSPSAIDQRVVTLLRKARVQDRRLLVRWYLETCTLPARGSLQLVEGLSSDGYSTTDGNGLGSLESDEYPGPPTIPEVHRQQAHARMRKARTWPKVVALFSMALFGACAVVVRAKG
jgi:DNA-binding CsgD family transcriptional regulator